MRVNLGPHLLYRAETELVVTQFKFVFDYTISFGCTFWETLD